MRMCEYGCGLEAPYPPRKGKPKWSCNEFHQRCPVIKKVPWNKGKVGVYTKDTIKKMSDRRKERSLFDYYKKNKPLFFKVNYVRPTNDNYIEVKCKWCDKWFEPSRLQLHERIRSIYNPRGFEEQHLYCSTTCKQSCPIYHSKGIGNSKQFTDAEYTLWRQTVLRKDEYECQMCGSKDKLRAHHINPIKTHPYFSLDPDNGITFCEECHIYKIHIGDCSAAKIASLPC